MQYYRSFQLRDMPALLAGRYRNAHLRPPTKIVFGAGDHVLRPEGLEGAERHAEDLTIELLPGVGHFVADEVPEIVVDRALSFFG